MTKEAEMYKGFQRVPGRCEGSSPGIEDTALRVCINLRRLTCVKGSRGRIIGKMILRTRVEPRISSVLRVSRRAIFVYLGR